MSTIVCLSPCLMMDNNRTVNTNCINKNYSTFKFDEYAICDQCFSESDYDPRFTYIAHSPEKLGWVNSRNKLLEYFYNSDHDYAFWIDANAAVSKTCVNDLSTILENLRSDKLSMCDAIFSTLGIWISQDRMILKSASDYFDTVHLIPAKANKSYNWMHGLIIKNYRKYYNQKFFMDPRCDAWKGIPEDVYFARLLRTFVRCYVAPTVVVSKASSKTSTWMHDKAGYEYPPVDYNLVDSYLFEDSVKNGYTKVQKSTYAQDIILKRNDYFLDNLKPFTPRKKSEKVLDEPISKVELF